MLSLMTSELYNVVLSPYWYSTIGCAAIDKGQIFTSYGRSQKMFADFFFLRSSGLIMPKFRLPR